MSLLEEGRGSTCSHFAHQIYCVYIAVTAKSHAKMIQNTATICSIACKILTLKYKYLVLFIKRLWAGSAYSKSLRKVLWEKYTTFSTAYEFGVIAVTMCHVGIDSTCRILFSTKVLCWRCQVVWDCWEMAIRPTSSQWETHLFPTLIIGCIKYTNSHNLSLSLIIQYFFVQVLTVLILFFYFHTFYHYCMLVFL